VFGDPTTTGKPAGDDLREGKRTVLVARAMARALDAGDDATVRRLGAELGVRDLADDRVASLAAAIAGTGAHDDVEQLIEDLAGDAFRTLEHLPLHEPGRTYLSRLAHAAVDRRS
jgi:geranylgeranyl diphosphate synthase type I